MPKFIVHYELSDEIEADTLQEAEGLAEDFCDDNDNETTIGHLTVRSITKGGDEEDEE